MRARLLLVIGFVGAHPSSALSEERSLRPAMVDDALLVIDEVARRVARARDCDGDGCADLVVARGRHHGAPRAIELVSGRTGASIRSLAALDERAEFPAWWDSGADVDGDGVDDLAIGSSDEDTVRIVSGANASTLRVLRGARAEDRYGATFAFAGDVDGDGRAELAVGTCGRARKRGDHVPVPHGYVVLHAGSHGRELWRVEASNGAGFGAYVGSIGDLDADGRRDLAIRSRPGTNAPVVLVSAARGDVIARWSLRTGRVLGTGDLDGDGVPEVLHEAVHVEGDFDTVRIHSGRTGDLLREVRGPDIFPDWRSLADVGDVDGDGVADFAIGETNFGLPKPAPGCAAVDVRTMTIEQAASLESAPDSVSHESGCVVVHSGRTGEVVFGVWAAREPRRGLGFGVARGPDVDGDGTDDLVVTDASRAYVVRVPPVAAKPPR